MSEQSNIYKLYQVMGYLSLSHGYRGVLLKGNVHRDEIWLVNRENKTYEIIRITMASLESVDYDRERIRQCIHAIASQVQIRDPRFLDIHIGKGEVLDSEAFDTLCLDIGYQNGIDISAVYPGLRNVIHHVDDPNAEIKQIFEEVNRNALNIRKNRRRFFKKDNICTVILLIVTLAVFAVSALLSMRYERSSVLVLLGADYKTFTLGLKQYWRLLSSMLVHGSFYHIFANSYSLYFLGSYIERQYGHGKFLTVLLLSVLSGSLAAGIMKENTLIVGMSGGLYGLMAIYTIDAITSGYYDRNSLFTLVVVNLAMNFYPNVCWQAHLGGAVLGLLCYTAFHQRGAQKGFACAVIIGLLAVMVWKYVSLDIIDPIYGGTDANIVEMLKNWGLDSYSKSLAERLLRAYQIYAR